MATITIIDEHGIGNRTDGHDLDLSEHPLSLRDLIRIRVEAEVAGYNAALPERARMLITPTATERALNGVRPKHRPRLDAGAQVERALDAFRHGGFLVLVGDRQVVDLEAMIDPRTVGEITFLRLVPLVGG